MVRDILKESESYIKLKDDIENSITPVSLSGVIPESLPDILNNLIDDFNTQILVVTRDEYRAKRLSEEIRLLYGNVKYFPKKDLIFYDIDASSREVSYERLDVMKGFAKGERLIAVSSIDALFNKMDTLKNFSEKNLYLEIGSDYEIDVLIKSLITMGYENVDMIEGKGQFSHRGGIIDIYPINEDRPYRIEFFDTEIDSIREFDKDTQRTIMNVDKVEVEGSREIYLSIDDKDQIIKGLKKDLQKLENEHGDNDDYAHIIEKARDKYGFYIEKLEKGIEVENVELLIPYLKRELSSILDFLSDESIVLIEDSSRVEESLKNFLYNFEIQLKDHMETGELLYKHGSMMNSKAYIMDRIKEKNVVLANNLMRTGRLFRAKDKINFNTKSVISYQGDIRLFVEDLKYYIKSEKNIIVFADERNRGVNLAEDLNSFGIEARYTDDYNDNDSPVKIIPHTISKGFEYTDIDTVFISYKDIFGSTKKKRRKRKLKNASKIDSFADLKIGDFVVHENHGVGKYTGTEQLEVQGINKDYLTIEYSGSDKLYIPIDQMNLVQKYIGNNTDRIKVNRLGSAEWGKTKARVRKAIEDMAKELIELYAKREVVEGYRFSEDTPWQKEFEDMFPYDETDDQLKAVEEIKKDMEKSKPMDRLLCGDVGYGKTEVALRAIFKAVMDGKQVAFLVPTTILAEQHYKTMIERFSNFPINIEVLSRFKTPSEEQKIIEGLKVGDVDVIVGTHKILSKNVNYKNLGLLVIDEEQRFGVKQKETIKAKKETVDVLTLTATPIPRTLHMSLSGIRDMSVLEEPPGERYPVQTYVMENNDSIIRDAVLKEINRGGQVYIIYNQVRSIDRFAGEIQNLIPEARVTVAHGQMGEKRLEDVMASFLDKEYDVLVCTTIIETGLDIPNVNTMIVMDSNNLGLSQLYQLRGRVGRSNRIAFAYLMYDKTRVLTELSEKRLKTIKEFTEFGSGFKIAMRDLEIRGGGNLLGSEQHGQMATVGYDLYIKFLDQAIKRLRGVKSEERIETIIDLNIDGYIKSSYISSEERKIEIYKKISLVETQEDVDNLIDELIDIYGDVSKEVMNLITISYIKNLASKIRISTVRQINNKVHFIFERNEDVPEGLPGFLLEKYKDSIQFGTRAKPTVIYSLKNTTQKGILNEIQIILADICSFLGIK